MYMYPQQKKNPPHINVLCVTDVKHYSIFKRKIYLWKTLNIFLKQRLYIET